MVKVVQIQFATRFFFCFAVPVISKPVKKAAQVSKPHGCEHCAARFAGPFVLKAHRLSKRCLWNQRGGSSPVRFRGYNIDSALDRSSGFWSFVKSTLGRQRDLLRVPGPRPVCVHFITVGVNRRTEVTEHDVHVVVSGFLHSHSLQRMRPGGSLSKSGSACTFNDP